MATVEETPDPGVGEEGDELVASEPSAYVSNGIPLRSGSALTLDEANALASEAGATLVVPLGPVKVGKTTLVVELYARYLDHAKWADCSFCGSDTLLDYEMLAFPSRLKSGGDLPDTWRTRLGEERHLLHMCLVDDAKSRTNLLFANMSGELSDSVRDGADPAEELPLLARAQRVLICVDGDWVATPALCGRAISDTRQLLGTLAESGSFIGGARAALVLTKWDKVIAAGAGARWEAAGAELEQRLGDLGMGQRSFRTAARPDGDRPPDDETEALMRWLVEPVEGIPTAVPQAQAAKRAMGRSPETTK